ncbi:MAG: polyhydroxyalkanoate depolymerase [Alphaproteobacteria bacterium]|nr:polyhydroxyalkanoate depolymerase [Alphaproteobacteria bacterium]
MLYNLYELHHASIAPVRLAADMHKHILRNPLFPTSFTPLARVASAAFDVLVDATRKYAKPRFDLTETQVDGATVAVRETVVARKTFCQLKRFEKARRDKGPKLLIVAPMSGHYATLLRDTVRAMLPHFDVHITDWRDARRVPVIEGRFDLDDYIDYVIDFLRVLGPETGVMAVCQPSVPVLAAVSLMEAAGDKATPAAMVLMGGPVDARKSPTAVNATATDRPLEWFEQNVVTRVPVIYPGFMRRVYPGFLQLAGFMSMNIDRHVDAHLKMFNHLVRGDGESAQAHRAFYEEYRAVMDLPAEFYLQTIKTVFQDFALAKGTMTSRGRKVDPSAITRAALATIEGENDDISGLGQTKAAHRLCANIAEGRRLHYVAPRVGHYGVFNGRRWRETTAPKVTEFLMSALGRKAG